MRRYSLAKQILAQGVRRFSYALTLLAIAPYSYADLLSSATITAINSQYNSSSWGAKNLVDSNNATRWLSFKQANDINFQLNNTNDNVCFGGVDLTNYGSNPRSVQQFMLLTTTDASLNADVGSVGWRPLVADAKPTGLVDYLSWAQGARLVTINSQYNGTTWAASHINDGDTVSKWLSRKANNIIEYNFDTDWNGVTGDGIPINEIELRNYGTTRSVKEFQIEVTKNGSTWTKLEVPGTKAADPEFIYSRSWEGGIIDSVDSQYNSTTWAAKNINDGDPNSLWLSRKGNNTIVFSFDPNNNGVVAESADQFSLQKIRLKNYGTNRSIREFQVAVKTASNPNWHKLIVPGSVVGTANYDFSSVHQGGQLTSIDSEYNNTSWAAENIHDGDPNTRWLSRKGNNSLAFQFDVNEDGVKDSADLFTMSSFYLQNYGVDGRSIKEFQVAVKTSSNANWTKLPVPGSVIGEANFNFAQWQHGGKLVAINSQYNTTSWAAKNIQDDDPNTRWLSRSGNNTLDFQFDVNDDGVTSGTADLFTMTSFYLQNYGVDSRSIKQFQVEVKTKANSNWHKLPVPGSAANQPNYNFALAAQGGTLTSIDSQYNTTSWAADNLHDGDVNSRWLSRKPTNTLTFGFDTDNNGAVGDAINLNSIHLVNYGADNRAIKTFAIDIQIAGGAWQPVSAPDGSTVFTANRDSNGQTWTVASYTQVTAARIRTLSNYGDANYTGARELEFLGASVGPSYTFTAAKDSKGETFTLDASSQPVDVTDVRLRTINNYGDVNYIGAREFKILGNSITRSTTFIAANNANGETFTLDAGDVPTNVTDVKLITINNYGDASYIGAREFKVLGNSITRATTFVASNTSSAQTFVLDNADIPTQVTAAKLITINNYGDANYIGAREFELIGPSVTASHTFTVPMDSGPHRIVLDSADQVTGVVGVRFISISNYGDAYYTGLTELKLFGTAIGPSYIFNAQNVSSLQHFSFTPTNGNVFRFHSLNNYGDNQYTGASELALQSAVCKAAQWRMNEGAWTGAANEVLDSSGGAYHGTVQGFGNGAGPNTAIASPAIAGDPGTCRYGEFDGVDDYIEIPNSADLDNTQQITIAAWFNANAIAQTNGTNARGLLSKRNSVSNQESFGLFFWNGHGNHLYVDVDGSNDRFASNTAFNMNTWYHITLVYDGSLPKAQRVRLYVNGVLDGEFAETSSNIPNNNSNVFIGNLFTGLSQLKVFSGAIDEVNILPFALQPSEVQALMNTKRPCAAIIDHYWLQQNTTGLTCAPQPITIKACTNSNCSAVATQSITLDVQANGVTQATPTFTGSTTVNINQPSPSTVTLAIANASINAAQPYLCNDGSANSCDIVFNDAGFRFIYGTDPVTPIADQVSGVPFTDTLKLQAVKNNNGVCTGLFNGKVDVQLAQKNVDPVGSAGLAMNINNSAIGKAPSYVIQSLTFNANSIATLSNPMYLDAGQILLQAKYDKAGISLAGNSNGFWVKPKELVVSASVGTTPLNTNSSSGTPTVAAGSYFTLKVNALNANGDLTQNYQPGQIQFQLMRTGPTSGGANGQFTYATNASIYSALASDVLPQPVTLNAFNGGSSTFANASYNEVGLLNLTVQDQNYHGAGLVTGNSINIGRFVPDHFDLAVKYNGSLIGGYGFVYTGQMSSANPLNGELSYDIKPEFTITAKNVAGTTTQNYIGNFVKLQASNVTVTAPKTDALQIGKDGTNKVALQANFQTAQLTSDPINNGVLNYQFNATDNFVYTRNSNAVIKPFTANIQLVIDSIMDSDKVQAHDTDSDNTNGILALNPSGSNIRFGRWVIENNFGPETSSLPLPMAIQYWDGSAFVTNTLENNQAFDATKVTISDVNLSPGSSTASGGIGKFVNGISRSILLSAPAPYQGTIKVTYQVPSWLQYDWQNTDKKADGPYTDNPFATVSFGLFRGNDRVIYWREQVN